MIKQGENQENAKSKYGRNLLIWLVAIVAIFVIGNRLLPARSIEIPSCSCLPDNDPGPHEISEEIDLDPTIHKYNKGFWSIRNKDGEHIRVYYTTREQLYKYLKYMQPGACRVTTASPGCMVGRYIVEDEHGKNHQDRRSPCEFPTPELNIFKTPVVSFFSCVTPIAPILDPQSDILRPPTTPTYPP